MMWLMIVWMVLFWGVVAAGAFWLLGAAGRRGRTPAADILDERLARGEIDEEEYHRRRDAISHDAPRRRAVIIGALAAVIVLLVGLPVTIMAAGAWDTDMDMWKMHGGGRDTSDTALVRQGQRAEVIIDDFTFRPGNLEVERGATVTWTNRDSASHDASARNGDWESRRLSRDDSDSLTFAEAGEYDYYCSIHPSMKARLIVR